MILLKKGRKTEFFMVNHSGHCATFSQKLGFYGDPYGAFLPPSVLTNEDGEADYMRAVAFVTEGTERSPQEYDQPLLVLTGEAYARMTFEALHTQLYSVMHLLIF
ncbi:MAG: hypothetical protein R6X32_00880 [Chloroflexota bacterium]